LPVVTTKSSSEEKGGEPVLAEKASEVGKHDDVALPARGLRLCDRSLLGHLTPDANHSGGKVDV
jgi:hypothetical protein